MIKINCKRMEIKLKEQLWIILKYSLIVCLEGLRKNTKEIHKDSRGLGEPCMNRGLSSRRPKPVCISIILATCPTHPHVFLPLACSPVLSRALATAAYSTMLYQPSHIVTRWNVCVAANCYVKSRVRIWLPGPTTLTKVFDGFSQSRQAQFGAAWK
jgi:hypothetical protein